MRKVGEYLEAGVKKVCGLDEQPHTAHVYSADDPTQPVSQRVRLDTGVDIKRN